MSDQAHRNLGYRSLHVAIRVRGVQNTFLREHILPFEIPECLSFFAVDMVLPCPL